MTQQSHALETTRKLASQAIERTGENLRDLREGLKDASADTQRQLGRYAKRTSRYVSQRPLTSTLMAAAAGAAVMALALAVLRNKRRHS
jgi:ElaB/YqjD/DUF883 family membrane-anchored ribosome-binding protein